jgi:hypothetical protein
MADIDLVYITRMSCFLAVELHCGHLLPPAPLSHFSIQLEERERGKEGGREER